MTNTEYISDVIENTEEITETELVEKVEVETFDPNQSNVENMVDSLEYMGQGMLGIFIVTVIIIACVGILNKVTNKKKKED